MDDDELNQSDSVIDRFIEIISMHGSSSLEAEYFILEHMDDDYTYEALQQIQDIQRLIDDGLQL